MIFQGNGSIILEIVLPIIVIVLVLVLVSSLWGKGQPIKCPECGFKFKRPMAQKSFGGGFNPRFIGYYTCPHCKKIARASKYERVADLNNNEPTSKMGMHGKKVAFQIDMVTDDVTAAIDALGYSDIEIDGNKILIALKNPEEENPVIVEAIISAGGHVKGVSEIEANG